MRLYELQAPKRLDETASPLTFKIESRGHHHGQSDMTLYAERDGQYVGHIDFVVYQGEVSIQMIKVPEARRQGVGTRMVQALQARYPDREISWGGMTEDGYALYGSLPKTEVENLGIRSKMERLEALRAAEAEDERITDEFHQRYPGAWTDEIRAAFSAAVDMDAWNDRNDEIWTLEQDLLDAKPSRTLIRTF